MPSESPLPMPVQDLSTCPPAARRAPPDTARVWRIACIGGAAAVSCAQVAGLILWSWDGLSPVRDGLVIALAASVTFWIALSATTVLAALFPQRQAERDMPVMGVAPLPLNVAILIPVYHEDPEEVSARALAMLRDLADATPRHRMSLFLLSDTRGDPRPETQAFATLKLTAPLGFPVHYRRRPENTDRKIGNVADWVRRWGGRYDAMVVLDADSLMSAATLLELADDMAGDQSVGLIQTVPQIIGAGTLFARAQQFASAAYGPLLARGLSRWSGTEGNFWGHNAIVRTRAFAGSACLPRLPSRRRGREDQLIWSHDFVEAALLRRRGWSVRLRPDLGGSFEETPPSLVDHILRDRRWCQGNLQHLRLLTTDGLHPLSRFHLLCGAAGYLMSVGWLGLLLGWSVLCYIGSGISDGTRTSIERQNDMTGGWALLALAYGLLVMPKLVATAHTLRNPDIRNRFGGGWRFVRAAATELGVSILYAPGLMVQQCLTIARVACGQTVGWSPQNRGDGRYDWRVLWSFHKVETLIGLLLAVLISMGLAAPWLAPVVICLVLMVPLSALSARPCSAERMACRQTLDPYPIQTMAQRALADVRGIRHRSLLVAAE